MADRETLFDIAFIDHRLPGGKGLDIVKLCRERGWAPGTKLILTTAEATAELLTCAAGLCDDVVIKPTGAKVIHALLERAGGAVLGAEFAPVLDRAPLAMLVKSGAGKNELTQMYNLFSSSVGDVLAQLGSGVEHAAGAEMLHRTQSACATMGAIALLKALRKLSEGMAGGVSAQQLAHSRDVFDQTKSSLLDFLQELPVRS